MLFLVTRATAGVDALFNGLILEVCGHGFDAEVAHLKGVLQYKPVDLVVFECSDEFF